MLFGSTTGRGRRGFFGGGVTSGLVEGDGIMPPMPGRIGGYVDRFNAAPAEQESSALPMFAPGEGGARAVGWDESNASLPQLPVPTGHSGMFGGAKPQASAALTEQPEWSASAMGAFPAHGLETVGSLPRRGTAQPYDYGAALEAMLPQRKKRSTLEKIAAVALPALMAAGGNQAGANAFTARMLAQRDARDTQRRSAISTIERWKHDDAARQQGADLRASAPFSIGRDRLQYDPYSGEVATLYDGQESFEQYADELGLEPGTPEYFEAVEDYVLRANGPSAYERDVDLDDYRTGNRLKIEGARQGNRESLEGIRQRNRVGAKASPTYRDLNPRAGRGAARPTATGPNGEKVEFDGTAWVPVR